MKATTVAGGSPDETETEETGPPAPDPAPTAPTKAAPEAEAGPEAEAAPEGEAGPEGEAEAGPEGEGEGEAAPEAEAEPAPTKAEAEPASGTKAEAGPDAEADAAPEAEAAREAGAQAGDEADPGPEDTAEVEAEAAHAPEAEANSEAGDRGVSEGSAKDTAGPGADPAARAEVERAAEARAPEADATPATSATAGAAPTPEADAPETDGDQPAARPGAKAASGAGSTQGAPRSGVPSAAAAAEAPAAEAAGPKTSEPGRAKTRAEAEANAETKTEARAEAKTQANADAETKAKAKTEVDAETDADVETDVETEAVGTGSSAARPVPSWARPADGGSERTSRFVALKPLDAPAPPPTPAPARAGAPGTVGAASPTAPAPAAPVPLELLAELTDTPQPPQTPRRRALRRFTVWTPVVLLLAGGFVGAQLLRPLPAPEIVATATGHTVAGQLSIPWPAKGQGAIRVPGSGDIATFGEQRPVPTASVAKVMTAYVILKGHPLKKNDPGPAIKVDAKTVADGTSEHESRIVGLTAGTEFSQQDMLKMLMIPSGNNVARLLARWDTGSDSEAAFVEKMNAAARELGMADTVYTDPSGLDAGTVSTATDQLKLAEAVMKDEAFRAIVALPSAPVKGLAEPLVNNNDLLNSSIRGIKTGSSTPAGGALMWAAYKSVGDETPLIIGTLMDQRADGPDPDALRSLALVKTNSKKIIEAVRTALASAPVVRKGDTVGYVDDGLGGRTPLVAAKDLNVVGVPGQQLKLTLTPGASPLPHAAAAGSEVAVLTAGDGEGAKSVPVAVGSVLAEPSFTTRLTRLG